jgi:3-phytase
MIGIQARFTWKQLVLTFGLVIFLPFVTTSGTTKGEVTATVETVPVSHDLDAADDIAIWIHPTDPSLSTIIGTDKKGALEVYDLDGQRLQRIDMTTNNIDLRYNFPLDGENVTLVGTYSRFDKRLAFFKVDVSTRTLVEVTDVTQANGYYGGAAMYHSPITGKYFYLSNDAGIMNQYELSDNGAGLVQAVLVRTVAFNPATAESEGIVADDILARIYFSDEMDAIYRLDAEPDGSDNLYTVDVPIAEGGHFEPDVEGLTIYYKSDGTGYLMASSQGSNSFNVYTREGSNTYIGTFSIIDGVYDRVTTTDGIDVTNFPLSPEFPYGLFVAQDSKNMDGGTELYQNFKYVPFEQIVSELNLILDLSWDPRLVGKED